MRGGQQQVDVEHLLAGLLEQEPGLALSILRKANVNVEGLRKKVEQELDRLVRDLATPRVYEANFAAVVLRCGNDFFEVRVVITFPVYKGFDQTRSRTSSTGNNCSADPAVRAPKLVCPELDKRTNEIDGQMIVKQWNTSESGQFGPYGVFTGGRSSVDDDLFHTK